MASQIIPVCQGCGQRSNKLRCRLLSVASPHLNMFAFFVPVTSNYWSRVSPASKRREGACETTVMQSQTSCSAGVSPAARCFLLVCLFYPQRIYLSLDLAVFY